MTLVDAAVLAVAGASHRRLLASAVRVLLQRATDEDLAWLPAPEAGEPVAAWVARCRGPIGRSAEGERSLERAAIALLERGRAASLTPLGLGTSDYPPRLALIPDPPPILWVRGDPACVCQPAVAMVGCRAATRHGLEAAGLVATHLAAAGWRITSGLARGIDAAAHAGCLSAGGQTVAVLGCGADRTYPPEHVPLADRIAAAGAVVSEFPPGTPPRAYQFPLRNRLISGLSVAVLVVEAPEKSGALITASAAIDQGREVFVLPGLAAGGRNRGGHLLIRDGAKLVESAADILQDLDCAGVGGAPEAGASHAGALPEPVEFTVDEFAAAQNVTPAEALARLLEWELSGKIQRVGGGRFGRSGTRVLT